MSWRLLPAGERAVLVEVADLDAVLELDAALGLLVASGDAPWDAVEDRVPAARTLLVTTGEAGALASVVEGLRGVLVALGVHGEAAPPGVQNEAACLSPGRLFGRPEMHTGTVEIPVVYDGPDLAEVARLTGLTPAEVVAAHTETPWRVGFAGFAPGFAYLVDGDPRLAVPRRAEPRTSVPAGAVGLAGAYSGVYPRSSPGGWQLVGRTDLTLWDAARTPPALLQPGLWVRFVVTDAP